ncbi:MAG TPA: YggS family pyridoxal phosphate-dependent enzyme, partial [Candidatus Limnocylindria bacterium]|nr:YggS family pyridoxal phosphate-dependent enzyme [Candidatus Limnocylindria bacterium]
DPHRLRIVAVTKGHPIAVAQAAHEAGITMLGESRVQEAEPKIAALPGVEWHFIGRIQSNKARRVIRSFEVIHSVDSVQLLQRLDRLAVEEDRRPRVLLQVNVTAEASKAGLAPADVTSIRSPMNLDLVGLMTIAPMGASEPEARAVFRRLRELRDRLQQAAGIGLPELSMGMSADAEAAAAEGATLVRIGTALFGHRR